MGRVFSDVLQWKALQKCPPLNRSRLTLINLLYDWKRERERSLYKMLCGPFLFKRRKESVKGGKALRCCSDLTDGVCPS